MSNELSKFEKAVLDKLLHGEIPLLTELRQQLGECVVAKREFTGFGFYTTLTVPKRFRRTLGPDIYFGDVVCEFPELSSEVGFLLYVKGGVLEMLEGYSYDEPWPSPNAHFNLTYIGGEVRDWKALETQLF